MCASPGRALTPGKETMVGNSRGWPLFHCETKATADVSSFSRISLSLKRFGLLKGEGLFRTNLYCPEINMSGDG